MSQRSQTVHTGCSSTTFLYGNVLRPTCPRLHHSLCLSSSIFAYLLIPSLFLLAFITNNRSLSDIILQGDEFSGEQMRRYDIVTDNEAEIQKLKEELKKKEEATAYSHSTPPSSSLHSTTHVDSFVEDVSGHYLDMYVWSRRPFSSLCPPSPLPNDSEWFGRWQAIAQLSSRHYDLPCNSCGRCYVDILNNEIRFLSRGTSPLNMFYYSVP